VNPMKSSLLALGLGLFGAVLGGCPPQPPVDPSSGSTPSASGSPTATPSPATPAAGPSGAVSTLPFAFALVEMPDSKLPALQSYVSAQSAGKWLVFGGRTAGLHGFNPGPDNFPRRAANTLAYVIDPAANAVLGSVDLLGSLPANLAGPLTATNSEFVQVGSRLFVLGGYGKDLTTGKNTTFGSMVSVDVDGLVAAILAKNAKVAGFFQQSAAPDNRLKVTGGALKYAGGIFYLAFGQNFDGDYSIENRDYNRAGGQFQQYTEKLRVFTLGPDLAIKDFNQVDGGYDPSLPYHRRDLNVVDVIAADGRTPGAVVYGGVFKAGQVAGFTNPIDIGFSTTVANATVKLQPGFNQALSQYDCAHVTVFDQASRSSFTTLLGGISQYHYVSSSGTLVRDAVNLSVGIDGLPFINTVSTLQHKPDATYAQFIQPQPLPGLLGAEAQFLRNPKLKVGPGEAFFENGVVNLAALAGRTLVGHAYGGIESFGPYSTYGNPPPGTQASARLFEVYITPATTPVLPMPPLPTATTPYPPLAR
jgi:hypothetical protein